MELEQKKQIIRLILLIIAFTLVTICSYIYLTNNTGFIENVNNLIKEKPQTINNGVVYLWGYGIILFIVAMIFGLKETGKVFTFFAGEIFLIFGSALFLIGVFISNIKPKFRFFFIFSSFIIYYTMYKQRELYHLSIEGYRIVFKKLKREGMQKHLKKHWKLYTFLLIIILGLIFNKYIPIGNLDLFSGWRWDFP